jgi:hypothetical protein
LPEVLLSTSTAYHRPFQKVAVVVERLKVREITRPFRRNW